ncbi:hypothetical protein RBH94_15880 [Aestuariibaculum sp. YM273]|uniref:hypothetical protein n=1 Tax=Aestuariibaculum sp. YM273 TaxID=3070659 RepID=UPI0027DE8B4D|nr:hypothetical protein [Aestuariibaculum sp. YM273]WMI65531.1 hypothetical protein RBH94_15880 [Aestuariibaculum sp. YM273]
MKLNTWMTSKEIASIANVHMRTIERRRNTILLENPDINWFKMESKPYLYHKNFLEEFISPEVFGLLDRNRQLSNTIKCMHRTGSLEQHLSFLKWDYFVTISYKDALSSKMCFSAMSELYEKIEAYSFSGDCRMFFTTEPFSNRKGYHNHLVLKMDANQNTVSEFVKKYSPVGIVDVQPYDYELAGVFYTAKDKHKNDEWDLLGNNLSSEGKELLRNYKTA